MGRSKIKNFMFWVNPIHWFAKDTVLELAKIDYFYIGYDKERRKLDVLYKHDPEKIENLELELKKEYNLVSEDEYQRLKIEQIKDPEKRKLFSLDYLLSKNEITQLEYNKEIATHNKEPWFDFDVVYRDGKVECDCTWNHFFIEYLKNNGYSGADDEIIDSYISDFGHTLNSDKDESSNINNQYRDYE